MLDNLLLEKVINGKEISIDIPENLKKIYISSNASIEKRDATIKIIEYLQNMYFPNFKNSFDLFKALKDFEDKLLYSYVVYYRDHFLHSFQVFLLGCYIIDELITNDIPFDFLSRTNVDGFLRTWFLISIYHDIGYLSQNLIKISENINKSYFKNISGIRLSKLELLISEKLDSIFYELLEEISYDLLLGEEKYFFLGVKNEDLEMQKNIYLNELIENYHFRNHGIISSLFLYYTLNLDIDFIIAEKKEEFLKEFKLASAAIATHDLEKQGRIHLNVSKNPFGCLLIICDNIQEWERPQELSLEKDLSDLWQDFSINADKDSNMATFKFVLNDHLISDIISVQNLCDNLFNKLENIFKSSIISGPNFTFLISTKDLEFNLTMNYNEKNNCYEFEKNRKKKL